MVAPGSRSKTFFSMSKGSITVATIPSPSPSMRSSL